MVTDYKGLAAYIDTPPKSTQYFAKHRRISSNYCTCNSIEGLAGEMREILLYRVAAGWWHYTCTL